MFLLGFRRMLTSLALCKSIESAIQLFQIHNRITFATIPNSAVYLSGARVSTFSTLVPRLMPYLLFSKKRQILKFSSATNYRWRFKVYHILVRYSVIQPFFF